MPNHVCTRRIVKMRAITIIVVGAAVGSCEHVCGNTGGSAGPVALTHCDDDHSCCAQDSGDSFGFCCPKNTSCAFAVAFGARGGDTNSSTGFWSINRNCCPADKEICYFGVGSQTCCHGPRCARQSVDPYLYGACCGHMCGDDLCDVECAAVRDGWPKGGICTRGTAAEGGKCEKA